jgi:hypothetical protein
MNRLVIDNEDYMLVVWADDPAAFAALPVAEDGPVTRAHRMSDNLRVLRVNLDRYNDVETSLRSHGGFKFVLSRFTSGSAYRSSDPVDQRAGSNVTGI